MNFKTETSNDWLRPQAAQQPLQRFLETIRERIWLILVAIVVTTGFAIAYVATAEKVYEADVQLVVSAIDDPDGTLSAIGLITQSNDPLRAIETAATLIKTNAAAELAAEEQNLDRSPGSILRDISIEPVAESDVLNITAEASTAEQAAALADAFAAAAIENRTMTIRSRIDQELPILEERLKGLPPSLNRDTLSAQIDRLATLRAGTDPNLQIVEPATPPGSPSSPRRVQSLLAGAFAGLVLGLGAAFLLQVVDPRLRREEQLRAHFRLPILARIPREDRAKQAGPRNRRPRGRLPHPDPLRWDRLSTGSIEAYRTLRAVLTRSARGSSKSILVTSPGPSEGKTTTAMSLAVSLALAGKSVILIEGDLRRPAIGDAFGISTNQGVASVLSGDASLAESLISAPVGGPGLELLLAEETGGSAAELLALPAAQDLIEDAKALAEFVVVDSPPLATVVDALPLARSADEIVLVVKLGTSRLDRIRELAELLADVDVKPTGFALIGTAAQREGYYARPEAIPAARWVEEQSEERRRGRAGSA